MKKLKILLIILLSLLIILFFSIGIISFLSSPINKSEENKTFYVNAGSTYNSLAEDLKEADLIRNKIVYKMYLKMLKPKNLEAGEYTLSASMNVKQIIETLERGAAETRETVTITFVEGKNMRYVIDKIVNNFNISESNIINMLEDEEYLNILINNHWILTDKIKNKDLYYSLEGYLFPDTYTFYKDSTIEDIFEKMINNLEDKLKDYKHSIESSEYTFHEMLTLSSIIEQEGRTADDRKGVAGVFYNRLKDNWSLGSDVTTYYAEKLELWSRDLYKSEVNACNVYNTRAACMSGELPVGPICNPSINSIISAIEPTSHSYYYFVADKNGKTYFNQTEAGHNRTISKLKSEGKWYEY